MRTRRQEGSVLGYLGTRGLCTKAVPRGTPGGCELGAREGGVRYAKTTRVDAGRF